MISFPKSLRPGCRPGWLAAVLLSAACLGPGLALAQSPFALTNIGQRLENDDARIIGRGGWGMTAADSLHPGFKNLACLTSIRHMALKFTALGDRMDTMDSPGQRRTYRTFSPDIRIAAPVIKGKFALTTGFVVDRSFHFSTLESAEWVAWDDDLTGQVLFEREGSLFRVPFGAAYEVIPGVSLSGAVNLQRGTIRESLFNLFQEPTTLTGVPVFLSNARVQEDEFSGTSYTFSAFLDPHPAFSLGFSFTPAHDIDVDRRLEMAGVSERSDSDWTMSMPEEFRAGFRSRVQGRWHLGADYQYQDFAGFSGNDDWVEQMTAESTISLGLERIRSNERRGGLGNLPLRLGASFRDWAYRVGSEQVSEKTFSVGTGFPFRSDLGQLDLALSYSIIGDEATNGMESKVWRMTISVTGLERWW